MATILATGAIANPSPMYMGLDQHLMYITINAIIEQNEMYLDSLKNFFTLKLTLGLSVILIGLRNMGPNIHAVLIRERSQIQLKRSPTANQELG